MPAGEVWRGGLVDRLAEARVAVLLAPGGYGKSTLAAQLVAARVDRDAVTAVRVECGDEQVDASGVVRRLAAALRRTGLTDAAATLAAGPGAVADLALVLDATEDLLVVVDEVEQLDDDAAGVVAELVDETALRHRWVLAGRRLAPRLTRLTRQRDCLVVTEEELLLGLDEVTEICRDAGVDAAAVLELSGGWAAAAVLAGRAGAGAGLGAGSPRVTDDRLLGALVDEQLGRLADPDAAALVQLAHLPLLDDALLERVGGPGLADRVRVAGVALRRRGDGWASMAGPVAAHLLRTSVLGRDVASAAADHYAERGEEATGLRVLLRVGADQEVARRVATGSGATGSSASGLVLDDPSETDAVLGAVDERALDDHPMALVVWARALRLLGLQARREAALGRAVRMAAGDAVVLRAAQAEQADDLAVYEDAVAAEPLAREVLTGVQVGERATRCRAMAALGSSLLRQAHLDRALVPEAARLLDQAARLAAEDGDHQGAARMRMTLAMDLHHVLGDGPSAVADLEQATALLAPRSRLQAVALALRAEVRLGAGDLAGAERDALDAGELGTVWGDHRALAYASWQLMEVASRRGRRDEVLARVAEVERQRGDWYDHVTGAIFLTEAVVALDRVAALHPAQLEAARSRGEQAPVNLALAEACVAARAGDVEAGRAALAVLDEQAASVLPRDQWWVLLLRACVTLAAGDRAGATSYATRAVAEAGGAERLRGRDEQLAARVLPLLPGEQEPGADAVVLQLFGDFAVTRSGTPVKVAGRPAEVLQLLVLRGGRAPVDVVVEELWPDEAPGVARQRLRNVLTRARQALGDVLAREGEVLVLRDGLEHDLGRFWAAADVAVRDGDAGVARIAVSLRRGPLLAELPYAEWAAGPRQQVEARCLELLDLLADDAADRDEVDETVRWLEQAVVHDPHDDTRQARAAGILLASGRRAAALAAADRAEAITAALGLAPSATVTAVRRRAAG